ncbi:MAG: serine hydrolase domain-containing protein [Cytophagales bacterium]
MHISKSLFVIFLIVGISTIAFSSKDESPDIEKLNAYLNILHLKKGFSGELLIAKGNAVLFQKSLGYASRENNLELKLNAKYRIASISKSFTGMLISIADQEGKLKLSDNCIDHIKDLSPKFEAISIEQLLTHTSGLPHNEGIEDYWLLKSKLHMTDKKVIEEINKLDLLFDPGSDFNYSSLGFFLLASILENAYQCSYEELLKEKILGPLQMTETGVLNDFKIIPNLVSGYHFVTDDSLVVAPYRNYSMLKGAGDMYSTASDLLKWNNSFNSKLLRVQKSDAFLYAQQGKKGNQNEDSYVNGWYLSPDEPKKQYHGGGTWGFSSFNAYYPKNNISIIILSNVSSLAIYEISSDIEKIVFGKPFELPPLNYSVKNAPDLDKYIGIYASDSKKMNLLITGTKNNLYAKLGNNPLFEIYPKDNHEFFAKKIEIEFRFEVNNDQITGLSAKRMGQTFHFNKQSK